MIQQPSQYDCDNMQKGDVIYVKQVSPFHKFIRKYFAKNLSKIKVRDGWEEPIKYVEYYQQDCTLIFAYEVACVQKYENEIVCLYSKQIGSDILKATTLPIVQVGLYNLQLVLDKKHTLTIPISQIHSAIEKNQSILKKFEDDRKIKEAIKFQKYKGSYFKEYVKINSITDWIPLYCSICGKPIIFKFNTNEIEVDNKCECKSLSFSLNKLSYDEFALWYSNQVVVPTVIKRYNDFWFKRGD